MTPPVITVLRKGGSFRPIHVVELREMLLPYWPDLSFFVCMTDMDFKDSAVITLPLRRGWPGYWSKMELFDPDVFSGTIFYLDLDVMPVGDMADFAATESLTVLAVMRKRGATVMNSSVMMLPEDVRKPVWDAWIKKPGEFRRRFGWRSGNPYGWGDQGFIQKAWDDAGISYQFWQDILPGQVESYKGHVLKHGHVGAQTRLVYFHGKPRPWDIDYQLPARIGR